MFVHVCVVLVFALKASLGKEANITVDGYENYADGSGNYRYGFNTSTGISIKQSGQVRTNSHNNESVMSVEGYYAYTSPNSAKHTVKYTADEKGYAVSTLYIRDKEGDKQHVDKPEVLEKRKNESYQYPYTRPNNMTSGYEIKQPDEVVSYNNTTSKPAMNKTTQVPQRYDETIKEVFHSSSNVTETPKPSNKSIEVGDRISSAGIAALQQLPG